MIEMGIDVLERDREESKFRASRKMGEVLAGRRDLKIRDKREMRVGRKERVEEEIQSHRGITKESFSLGDERREGRRENSGRGGKPKGELDIYIGDSRLCTKENPFKRRIARTRPRRIRRGWLCRPRMYINFSEFFIR